MLNQADYENFALYNARVVTPNGIINNGVVVVEKGIIQAVRERHVSVNLPLIDGNNYLLMPGFIDIHGDSLERAISPRPKTPFPIDSVLQEYDTELAALGISTGK